MNEIIKEIRKLIAKANFSCFYTDKFDDFIVDLEKILDDYEL